MICVVGIADNPATYTGYACSGVTTAAASLALWPYCAPCDLCYRSSGLALEMSTGHFSGALDEA